MERYDLSFTQKTNFIIYFARVFLLLTIFLAPAHAAWFDITPATIPTSEQIKTLIIDPHNPANLYTTTTNTSVFKSTDGGTNWISIDTTSGLRVDAFVIDPITPDTIYAAFTTAPSFGTGKTGAIYKSEDGGITWADMNAGLPSWSSKMGKLNSLVIDPITPSTMYVGNLGGTIYKSTNNGVHWSVFLSGDPFASFYVRDGLNMAIDPFTASTIYAADTNSNYVVKTIDGGTSWSFIDWVPFPKFQFDQTNPNTFYLYSNSLKMTVDGGVSWAAIAPFSIGSLVSHPVDLDTLYGSGSANLYKTTDMGSTWTTIDNAPSGELAIDSSGKLFVFSSEKIYKRADTAPDVSDFGFANQTGVALSALSTSNTVTISGLTGSAALSITGGEYSINDGTYTSANGFVNNDDTLVVRTTSSASFNTAVDVVLTIDGVSDTFRVTTLTDTVPDAFAFIDQTWVELSALTSSNTVRITGLGASAAVSISNGEYNINDEPFTSAGGFVNNNDRVTVRTTSSTSFNTATDVVLTIGGISDTFTVTTLSDNVPDTFTFVDQTGVELSILTNSNTETMTGLGASATLSISGGEYSINDAPYASAGGFVNNNDKVTVRTISSASFNTAVDVVLTIGGISDTFTVTTLTDTVPDTFAFVDQTGAALSTLTTSSTVTITGLGAASALSITGGEHSINGGTFGSNAGLVNNNDTVTVRTTSSASFITTLDVVLTIGGIGDTFTVTTLTDTVPDAFVFVDQTGVALSTLTTSNTVTITGLGAASAVSITGGEYSVNGGSYASASSFVNDNDTLAVRTTSSASFSTAMDVVLTIGGVSDTFTLTTLTDTVPDAFAFVDQTGAALSSLTTSNTVTITGLGAASTLSITGGTYSLNGGSYTAATGTVSNNETVTLRTTSSASSITAVNVVLTIGGVSDTFTVTTEVDSDADGVGDSTDAFPNDATETVDTDNDGVGNNADAFPNNAAETADTDSDGVGDNADAFPDNIAASVDANNNDNPDEWNAACDTTCQNNSGLTLDGSGGGGGGGSTNPLLLSLLALLVMRLRRRTII